MRSIRFEAGIAVAVAVIGFLLLSSLGTSVVGVAPLTAGAAGNVGAPLAQAEASLGSGAGPAGGSPATCLSASATSATCSTQSPSANAANTTGGEWEAIHYSRAFTALAYDSRDGYVVAFGGKGNTGQPLGDTWRYVRGNWSIVLTATAPSPRWGAAVAYDTASAAVVLFGGTNGVSYFNDTWAYSGGVWTNLSLSHAPSPRAFAGMTYDAYSTDAYTILFGGSRGTTYFGGTWEFHNHAWTNLSSSVTGAPPALGGASFAYDDHIGETVLFGGINATGYQSTSYQYRDLAWSVLTTVGPSAAAYAGMAFSRASAELVLFGGYDGSTYLRTTWVMTGETWSGPYIPTGLTGRDGVSLAFDGLPGDNYVVAWGGYSGGSTYSADTWSFNATLWTEVTPGGHPPALTGASLVDDPSSDYAVLFGGFTGSTYSAATWLFSGGRWTELIESTHPSARSSAAATYSRSLGGVVLFGGYGGGTTYFNDTWEFINGSWKNVTSGPAPPARADAGFAFEGTPVNKSILFGGRNSTTSFSDTWQFVDPGWSEVFPTDHPSGRSEAAMTYDPPNSYVLLFGGLNGSRVYNDTWEYRGVTDQWINLTSSMSPQPSPPARFGAGAAYDPYNGYVVLTGGYNLTHYFNDTWGFVSGNWTDFQPPIAPSGRLDAGLTFVLDDHFIAEFGGTGSGASTLSDTWIWVAFSAAASATPDPTDVGVPVSFAVSASAGVLPYSYSWAFGDGAANSTATPAHNYSAPGTYLAIVTVTDSKSPTPDQTTANVTVAVNPALTVTVRTTPAPTNGAVDAVPGYTITFNSTEAGGTAPFTYAWEFGDGSVAGTENATHAYAAVGTYNATVFVNDTAGASVNQTVEVVIFPNLAASVSLHPSASDVGVPVAYGITPIGGVAPYSYSWQFGDGAAVGPQSTNTTTHAYSTQGTFAVHYWVNDSLSHSFNTTLTVSIAPAPSATVRAVPTTVDIGVPVAFNSTVSNGTRPYTYLWTFGDGSTATTANSTHEYTSAGPITVTFNVTDAVGQSAQVTRAITVVASPTLTLSASPSSSEVGVPVSLSATASGGIPLISYAWHFGDGATGTGATVSHTYTSSGVFVVTGWANDSLGVSAETTTTVHVAPRITSSASASPISVDIGVPVAFTGSSAGGVAPVAYAWTFGDGAGAGSQNATHAYSVAGTYPVYLWANDSLRVSAVSETNVTVVADPSVSAFTAAPNSVKNGDSVTFSVTVSGGTGPYSLVYSGLPSGCSSANRTSLTCRPSATGTYTVLVNVTDHFGKLATGSVTLKVTSSSSSTFLGLPSVEGYLLLAAIVIIVAALIAWAALRGRRGKKGASPSASPPSSEGSTAPESSTGSPPSSGGGS